MGLFFSNWSTTAGYNNQGSLAHFHYVYQSGTNPPLLIGGLWSDSGVLVANTKGLFLSYATTSYNYTLGSQTVIIGFIPQLATS